MTEKSIDRRKLFKMAGAAGVGGAAVAVGMASPAAAVGGYVFNAISPYRSYDSRSDNIVLGPNDEFDIDLVTDEFGDQRIPNETPAVTYNLTIANTTGQGFLGLWPANVLAWPGNSSINWWQSGLLLANGGTVAIGFSQFINRPGSVAIHCGGGGSTAFILDVTGYYS